MFTGGSGAVNGGVWFRNDPLAINNTGEIAKEFSLEQNYPNPFNPVTKIKFQIPVAGFVQLKIFDVLGREISTLLNKELVQGSREVEWDASAYPGGVYYYRIVTDKFTETKKMILIK